MAISAQMQPTRDALLAFLAERSAEAAHRAMARGRSGECLAAMRTVGTRLRLIADDVGASEG
jgi:hypothetical protein